MLDTPQDLDVCEAELGLPVEQLFTPLTRRDPQRPDAMFTMDNGAFGKFNFAGFEKMLVKHLPRQKLCRWVACPDVVGSARRTLEAFEFWQPRLVGWKVALVAQDGIESLPIPWDRIDAVFIGGSTKWKLSSHAADVIRTAKLMDKWAHAGRVNTPGRYEYFAELKCDSLDGTGLAQFTWMREEIHQAATQPGMFTV